MVRADLLPLWEKVPNEVRRMRGYIIAENEATGD
jgi:hypothetical protein